MREIDRLFKALKLTRDEEIKKRRILEEDMRVPVKLIGIGQTGVGKTELLRSIFRIDGDDKNVLDKLKTKSFKSETKSFFKFTIKSENDLKVQFTDGPGLGEDAELDETYIEMWIDEIPKNDLLYWVLDAPSRDIAHIQIMIKKILDATSFHDRTVIVLNKVDKFELTEEEREAGNAIWDNDFNVPTDALEKIIKSRTDDIIEKLERYTHVDKDRIVPCSALRRWNHGLVFDRLIECLPDEKKFKLSSNREIKDFSELMTEVAKKELRIMRNKDR